MAPIIDIKNLKKTFKTHERGSGIANALKSLFKRKYVTKQALKGISFSIEEGEIVGFIGPNGAGKSTAIKAMSGVLYPTSGKIKIMDFVPWKEREEYVKDIGVVFGQKHQLYWDLPAIDTFSLHKSIYEIPDEDYKKRLDYMIELLDMKKIIKVPVRDLSLGERMKCQIVAALLHNPKIVFLDEPTIGLDVVAKDRLRDFIKEVNQKQGTTFIITTHDMGDIEKLCKRIIIINHGKIVYDGLLEKIRRFYINRKIFEVKLESKLDKKFHLPHCTVSESGEYSMTIEADTGKTSIRNVIDHLITNFEIADITISDPPIEEIIQIIYKEKK
ncbi:ATP-binding cassette domain-containing protein [Candidatus Woesearchaeota archaeon]|nr:ATP-binding cassette domain-containing protein [Candidatus Woesearchaeota archaeon]